MRPVLMLLWLLSAGAQAADYPRVVTDLAGRSVTLAHAPQRIVLQDSNDVLALALLERENPLKHLVAWDNNLASSDPGLWNVIQQRWPEARNVQTLAFPQSGQLDIESLLRTHPDLIIARLSARSAIDNTVLQSVLQRLGIALIYVDSELDPLVNVPRSIELLGHVLGAKSKRRRIWTPTGASFPACNSTSKVSSRPGCSLKPEPVKRAAVVAAIPRGTAAGAC